MLDLIQSLIDRGIQFLREGQERRKAFFREIVEPTHATFEQFSSEHITTFVEVKDSLHSGKPLREISRMVERRHTQEYASWSSFRHLDELGDRVPLEQYFARYVEAIQTCFRILRPTERKQQRTVDIAYYTALEDDLQAAISSAFADADNADNRRQLETRVDEIAAHFKAYRSEVESSYLQLKQHCLV